MLTDRQLVLTGMLLQFVLGGIFVHISSTPKASTYVVARSRLNSSRCPQLPALSCAPSTTAVGASEASDLPVVDRNTFLLVLVVTQAERFRERTVARETWISGTDAFNDRLMIRFVMPVLTADSAEADEVFSEATQCGDIVFLPGLKSDSPGRNLRTTLLWAHRNINFKYYMKTDDSVYISVTKIMNMLTESERASAEVTVWGHLLTNRDARRYVIGRGNMWLWLFRDYTLPVVYPAGYILPRKILEFVAGDEDETLLRLFTDEGLTMAGWISVLNISYEALELYRPLEDLRQSYCPVDSSAFHLFEYSNILAGFRNLHGCMSMVEEFAAARIKAEKSHNSPAVGVRLHRKKSITLPA